MSVKKVLVYGNNILRKKSKEVNKLSSKIHRLVDDLIMTMYAQNGVGLAAPQIGENLRIFVIDTALEEKDRDPIVFINPKIIKKWGAVNSAEGCLSFPQAYCDVRRYANVVVRAKDRNGKVFEIEATDGSLFCRAIQHELDHLDGVLFIDRVRNRFEADRELAEKALLPIEVDKLIEEAELEKEIQFVEELKSQEAQ